jgi:hypothetical protein
MRGELFGALPLFELLLLAVIRTEIEMVRKMEMVKEMEMEMIEEMLKGDDGCKEIKKLYSKKKGRYSCVVSKGDAGRICSVNNETFQILQIFCAIRQCPFKGTGSLDGFGFL